MALLAIAIPIPANKMDQWRAFVAQLTGARKADFAASRNKLKVRERTFHQQTPQGDLVVVTLEGDDPAGAMAGLAEANDPFMQWFKEQVMEIHGVDFNKPPPGPLPKLIVDSGA
jgi:hypothetical protein